MNILILIGALTGILQELHLENHQMGNKTHFSNSQECSISIMMPDAGATDTFTLRVYPNILSEYTNRYLSFKQYRSVVSKDSLFHFKVPDINKPVYIILSKEKIPTLGDTPLPILNFYLLNPGDNISINIAWDSSYHAKKNLLPALTKNGFKMVPEVVRFPHKKYLLQYKIHFSGKGAAKYECRREIDKASYSIGSFKKDSLLSILLSYKGEINKIAYEILKADVIANYDKFIYAQYYRLSNNRKQRDSIKDIIENDFGKIKAGNDFSRSGIILSRYYPRVLLIREYIKFSKTAYKDIYADIKKSYNGELRDKLITIFALERYLSDSTGILLDALNTVKTFYCLQQLRRIYNGQATGMKAYNFALPDTGGNIVKLSDFKGKVIFIDFWFTGCHACAGFYQEQLIKVEKFFQGNDDVVFISISIDRDKKKWLKSISSDTYTSQNAINLYTRGKGSDSPVIQHYHVIGCPQTYIIDRKGKFYDGNKFKEENIKKSIAGALLLD